MGRKCGMLATALLGGMAFWLWQQARQRGSGVPGPREITRWEDEGGNLPRDAEASAIRDQPAAGSVARPPADDVVGSTPDAWKFPKS